MTENQPSPSGKELSAPAKPATKEAPPGDKPSAKPSAQPEPPAAGSPPPAAQPKPPAPGSPRPAAPPQPAGGPPRPGQPPWPPRVLAPMSPPIPFNIWPERVWPVDRKTAAPVAVLAAALLAGLVGALAFQLSTVGIGFVLVGAAVLATALATRQTWPAPAQAAAAVSTCALLGVGAVRSAGWLFVLCLLAALATGALALVGGRTWSGLVLGVASPLLVPARTVGWTLRGIIGAGSRGPSAKVGRLAGVAGVTAVLVIVFGALFVSADAVFARIIDAVLPEFSVLELLYRTISFGFVAVVALIAACLAHRPPRFDELAPGPGRPLARWEWAVPLAVLDLLFASFVTVQLTVLFGGRDHVLSTGSLTYAEYARQGFWQLLVVTALTLAVVAVAVRKAGRVERADRVLVRVLLGLLCGLALVIVGSALRRLWLYEDTFGFTRLRIFVNAVELWLGVVFVLVLVAGVALRGWWLPRAIAGTAVLTLLCLAVLNPDAYIAQGNLDRYERTGRIDIDYLSNLTADAVPALNRLPEPKRSCALRWIRDDLNGDEQWYRYNWAKERARDALAARPVGDCPER